MGRQHSRRLGNGHPELRLVDQYRPRRNFDLSNSPAAATEMAHLDQSVCRGDDVICSGPGWHVSDYAPGPAVAGVLAVSLSEHDGHLATVPEPPDVGRVRGVDVCDGFSRILVRWSDSGFRDAARPRQ